MKSLKAAWDAVWVAATFAEAGEWQTAQELGQQILRDRFPLLHADDVESLPEKLKNPLKYRFRSILFVKKHPVAKHSGFCK